MLDLFKTNGASPPKPDFDLSGHGTVYLLRPLTPAAHAWVEEHLPEDAAWFADAIVVEHRFISPIIRGAVGDGLRLRVG